MPAKTTPVPIATGRTEVPNMPNPMAPKDWNTAKADPAATDPIPAWIPAAVVPATIPVMLNPTVEIMVAETALPATTVPVPMANPIADLVAVVDKEFYDIGYFYWMFRSINYKRRVNLMI